VEAASQETAGDLELLPLLAGAAASAAAAPPAPSPPRSRGAWPCCARAAAAAERGYDVDEHLLSAAALGARLRTAVDAGAPALSRGLTEAEAAARLAARGPNALTPPAELHPVLLYLWQMTDLLLLMLLFASALSFASWGERGRAIGCSAPRPRRRPPPLPPSRPQRSSRKTTCRRWCSRARCWRPC
jgi:hypothetical protein